MCGQLTLDQFLINFMSAKSFKLEKSKPINETKHHLTIGCLATDKRQWENFQKQCNKFSNFKINFILKHTNKILNADYTQFWFPAPKHFLSTSRHVITYVFANRVRGPEDFVFFSNIFNFDVLTSLISLE